jgi:hypothetical protein
MSICARAAVQCSTVQYSAVQCSTVQYSAVQCSTVQYSAVQCSTVQYSAVQCSTAQYSDGDARVLRCAAHRHVRPNDSSRSITTSMIQSRPPILPQHAHDTPREHTHTHAHTHTTVSGKRKLNTHFITLTHSLNTQSLIHVIITHSRPNLHTYLVT